MLIRKADPKDFTAMNTLFQASARRLCSESYDAETLESWVGASHPDRFYHGINIGNEQYVLVNEGIVVCYGEIHIQNQKLAALFVDPEYAGQGIGQTMIEFLFQRARDSDVSTLFLDASLNAAPFYAKNGFVEIEKRPFKTYSGAWMDSVRMECSLVY